MMMRKILFIDVDGTLVDYQTNLPAACIIIFLKTLIMMFYQYSERRIFPWQY